MAVLKTPEEVEAKGGAVAAAVEEEEEEAEAEMGATPVLSFEASAGFGE